MGQALTESIAERLQGLYRRYVGEPESLRTVYGGFGLFFAGITLSVAGVLVFLVSTTMPESGSFVWQLREIASTLVAIGFPVFLFSFLVLLPVDPRAVYGAGVGGVICLGAVGLFVYAYPYHWNVPGQDYSPLGVVIYAIGGVILAAATGSALVTNYIRQAGTAADVAVPAEPSEGETREEISDEEIRRDIDDALSDTELTWGGIEKTRTKRIQFEMDEMDIDTSGMDPAGANETRTESVDREVEGLQKLRGSGQKTAKGAGTDAQADALKQLRERQEAEPETSEGFLQRIRDIFST